MTKTTRLLLVDENDDVLDGLSAWLGEIPGLEVIGIAHSGREGLEQAWTQAPDVVLMDISLPDMSGLEATRRIKSVVPAPLVVLMAFHDNQAIRAEAKAAGADGFLSKPEVTAEILSVIDAAMRSTDQTPVRRSPVEKPSRASQPRSEVEE